MFSILSDLDIQPPANPYRSRFSNTIFYPAQMLTHDLQQKKALPGNDDPSSAYWSAIWDAVSDTTPSAHNLHNFDLWIRVHVFGGLRFTKELGERVQKLGEEEDGAVSALVQSADETWYAYVRGWIAWLFFYQGGRNGRLF